MAIDRVLWQSPILLDHVPNWPCPHCNAASLTMEKDSFRTVFDGTTHRNWNDPHFEAIFATGHFVCLLSCTKTGCKHSCAVAGNFITGEAGEYGEELYSIGQPTAITPPPHMIRIPKSCPDNIRSELLAAFGLFWPDHASSLNRIRNAIELLLTAIGVKRKTKNANGKLKTISLDSRIEILRSKNANMTDMCNRLLAVKHLGNAGSHPGNVHIDDVFDGLEILEQVLDDTYSKQVSVLAKMVKQINHRKGPRKKDK